MPSGYGPVESSTRAQLRSEGILLGEWGLAAGAVQLAKRLDRTDDAAKYAAGLRELRTTLAQLRDVRDPGRPAAALPAESAEPEAPPRDHVDELAARRDRPVS